MLHNFDITGTSSHRKYKNKNALNFIMFVRPTNILYNGKSI